MYPASNSYKKHRLIALCLVGFLALNYPILYLFDRAELYLGIPVLFLYLFIFWGFFILMTAMVVEKNTKEEG
ncbi:MAG: hypothetical protein HQL70_06850 [Magnetococcales bacterium]|nr:hypothetical protein [Magnetococcales bacterium]